MKTQLAKLARWSLHVLLLSSTVLAQDNQPHAEQRVTVEDGISVSYLRVDEESLPRETVTVEIVGLSSDDGFCAIMMASDKKKYYNIDPRKPRKQWIDSAATATDAPIKDGTSKFVIHEVPHGEYVVAAFHDENKNQLLDTNRLGLPTESYGFTRGVRWGLKIPKWNKAKFTVDGEHTTCKVKVR